jgi:hypothetical protein
VRGRRRRRLVAAVGAGVCLLCALAGCGGRETNQDWVSRASALSRMLAPASDTFINSHNPDNNNGASLSIFTGLDGMGGVMRGLIRFDLPAALQGRVTVTGAQLSLTTRGLGPDDTIAGTTATESLQAVGEAWAAGNGAGNVQTMFVVGEPCGGAITGATWNQPDCGAAGAAWAGAGASGAAAVSGQAVAPASPGPVGTWDGTAAGNAGMLADVQRWIDTPSTNHGWRINSSTEAAGQASAQRFYASEAPVSRPALALAYDCKAGFIASGDDCVDPPDADAAPLDADAAPLDAAAPPLDAAAPPLDAAAADGARDAAVSDGAPARDGSAPSLASSGCACLVSGGRDGPVGALIFAGALVGLARRRRQAIATAAAGRRPLT